MSIGFNEISKSLKVPGFYTEFDNSAAAGSAVMPWNVLVIGQQTGSAASEIVLITDDSQADKLFGCGSQLARMLRAYRKANKMIPLYAYPVADAGSSTAATKTVTVSGNATEGGSIALYVGGQLVKVAVTAGESAATIAGHIADAVGYAAPASGKLAGTDTQLPFVASVQGAVVTLTAKNKGACGNDLDVRVNYNAGDVLPAGVGVAVAKGVVGSGDPSLSGISGVIGDRWFNVVVSGVNDSAAVGYLKADAANRWQATVQQTCVVMYGKCFDGESDPFAAAKTYYDGLNSQLLLPVSLIGSPTPCDELAATFAGVAAESAEADPAMPIANLALEGVLAPDAADALNLTEKNLLLGAGCTLIDGAFDGTVYVRRAVTTYKKNAAGGADESYQQLETIFSLSYFRWGWNNRMATKYGRCKLAADGTDFGPGQVVMTPSKGKAEALAYYKELCDAAICQGYEAFKENLVVEIDSQNKKRLNFLLPAEFVGQLFTCASKVLFK